MSAATNLGNDAKVQVTRVKAKIQSFTRILQKEYRLILDSTKVVVLKNRR